LVKITILEEGKMSKSSKRIFIVGHSGAGKGVLAQAIAKKLGWKYVDADFSLAPSIGRPLKEILSEQGEKAFHKMQTEILSNLASQENIVVTTDDSIICDDKNRDLLSAEFTVYLQVSPEVQLERISYNRPLAKIKDYGAFLNTLRSERDAFYEQVACFSLSSDNGDIDAHVNSVVKAFDGHAAK
jgi:shikimate kinase